MNTIFENIRPKSIVSPSIFFGWNNYTCSWYTFLDTKAKRHVLKTYENAKQLLVSMFSDRLHKLLGPDVNVEEFVKIAPNGSAYLSAQIY